LADAAILGNSPIHSEEAAVRTIIGFRVALVVAGVMGFWTTGQAEEGTFAQRNACKPDVFRLCKEFIPDRTAITDCLERNKQRLNPDCKAVFDNKLK